MEITWRVILKALVGIWLPAIPINLFGRGQSHSPAPGGKLRQFCDFFDNSDKTQLWDANISIYQSILQSSGSAAAGRWHSSTQWVPLVLSLSLCLLPELAYPDFWLLCGWSTGQSGWWKCVGKFLLDRYLHKTALRSLGLPRVEKCLTLSCALLWGFRGSSTRPPATSPSIWPPAATSRMHITDVLTLRAFSIAGCPLEWEHS